MKFYKVSVKTQKKEAKADALELDEIYTMVKTTKQKVCMVCSRKSHKKLGRIPLIDVKH